MSTKDQRSLVATFLFGVAAIAGTAGCEDSGACPELGGPEPGATCVASLEMPNGELRSYRVHAPVGYADGSPAPVILNLPGLGEPAELHEFGTGMSDLADEEGFIAVYPEPAGGQWRFGRGSDPDMEFLVAMLDELELRMDVDTTRVYATGISSGGAMVHDLACAHSDRIAGLGMVAPSVSSFELPCETTREVPTFVIGGGRDPVVPFEGNFVMMPLPEVASGWAERNGAASEPVSTLGEISDRTEWLHATTPNGDVRLDLVHELAHFWPTERLNDYDATAELWAFLSTRSL